MQYLFCTQWQALKEYANSKHIQIIGDLPIYIALDSVDVWSSPQDFQLDADLNPEVAGCPPDGFSATGRSCGGNPLYDWGRYGAERLCFGGFVASATCAASMMWCASIHFRGFPGYYAIPYGNKTAEGGRWRTGPMHFLPLSKKSSVSHASLPRIWLF